MRHKAKLSLFITSFAFLITLMGVLLFPKSSLISAAESLSPNATPDSTLSPVKASLTHNEWSPYIRKLHRRIRQHWKQPPHSQTEHATFKFIIHKNGQVSDISVKESSGNSLYNQTAQQAIEAAAPFSKFPKSYKSESIAVEFVFNYTNHTRP